MEVLPGIYRIPLPMAGHPVRAVNSYLLASHGAGLLVDCGWDTPDVAEALQRGLAQLGLGLEALRALCVTHFHSDHYGSAGTLKRLVQVELLMHRRDWLHVRTNLADFDIAVQAFEAWLERNGLPCPDGPLGGGPSPQMYRRFTVAAPTLELEDGEELQVGEHTLKVVWTPGHTEGHVCLYEPRRRVLFSGDHLLDPISPHVGVAFPDAGDPLGDFLASLRKIAALEVDLVLPAHGEPFTGVRRRVGELLAHHAEREAQVLAALPDGGASAASVAARLPWTRRATAFSQLGRRQQQLALSETLAHLEHLRARGLVASEPGDDGVVRYRRTAG